MEDNKDADENKYSDVGNVLEVHILNKCENINTCLGAGCRHIFGGGGYILSPELPAGTNDKTHHYAQTTLQLTEPVMLKSCTEIIADKADAYITNKHDFGCVEELKLFGAKDCVISVGSLAAPGPMRPAVIVPSPSPHVGP